MFGLYLGDIISGVTIVLVLGMLAFIVMQGTVCSVAGGAIFISGIVSIFFKKQNLKRICFYTASALFTVQAVIIESSRIAGIL